MHIALNFSQAQIFKGWIAPCIQWINHYPLENWIIIFGFDTSSTCLMVSGDLFTNTIQPLNNWGC